MNTDRPSCSPFGAQRSYSIPHIYAGTAFSLLNARSIIGRDGVSPTYVLLRRNGATAPATYSASNVAGSKPTGHAPRDVSCCMTATNLLRWAAPRATFQTVTCAASIPVYGAA